jgi:8-oxo-dGTP diphosphatase
LRPATAQQVRRRTTEVTLSLYDELAAEHISGMRWRRHPDIGCYRGTDLFSPRDIAAPLAALIAGEIPGTPLTLGR